MSFHVNFAVSAINGPIEKEGWSCSETCKPFRSGTPQTTFGAKSFVTGKVQEQDLEHGDCHVTNHVEKEELQSQQYIAHYSLCIIMLTQQ